MASAFAHAAAGVALWPLFRSSGAPKRAWIIGAALAVAPDIDVLGFRFGVRYGDVLGHRGLTHSLLVATVVGALVGWVISRSTPARWPMIFYCIVAMASHGLLDAMTTGGLGVALWSPIDVSRHFFPWRPIAVSPIGIRPFFTRHGLAVLRNEAIWVGIPSAALAMIGVLARRETSTVRS